MTKYRLTAALSATLAAALLAGCATTEAADIATPADAPKTIAYDIIFAEHEVGDAPRIGLQLQKAFPDAYEEKGPRWGGTKPSEAWGISGFSDLDADKMESILSTMTVLETISLKAKVGKPNPVNIKDNRYPKGASTHTSVTITPEWQGSEIKTGFAYERKFETPNEEPSFPASMEIISFEQSFIMSPDDLHALSTSRFDSVTDPAAGMEYLVIIHPKK